ncbi:MAG: Wzz/FepE/Etk N-terminal domain-containing protein [Gemmatimonadaceae bacterium]|nr:Wzz/FepE/Etk N-terminal domain-containing protein [Gemmatimonadaceae bacterium]
MTPELPPNASHVPLPVEEFSIVELRRGVLKRWRWLVLVPLAAAAIGGGAAAVWPKTWTATTSFVPEQALGSNNSSILGAIGGLGSLLGEAGGASALARLKDGPSTEFFADVLTSSELLTATLKTPFTDPEEPAVTRPLLELIDVKGPTPERRFGNGLRKFKRRVLVVISRKSSIVNLSVTLKDPVLSASVANRMLELLNRFNLERRQRASTEQRRFAELRLGTAKAELDEAERAKQAFLDANRNYYESPRLMAMYEQFDRAVRVKEGILIGLTKTFEESRVAEVRDTPLLTVVDVATPPDRPLERPLLWGGLAAGAGVIFGFVGVIFAALSDRRAPRATPRIHAGDAPIRAVS